MFLFFVAAALLGAVLHLALDDRPSSRRRTLEVLLAWFLGVNVGIAGILGFVGHTLRADETAAYIGWPPGSGFQFEVAVANLAFGVLGLLCTRLRGGFWTATVAGQAVFSLGAAVGHVRDLVLRGNASPGNAGAPLYLDVALPLLLVALLVALRSTERKAPAPRAPHTWPKEGLPAGGPS